MDIEDTPMWKCSECSYVCILSTHVQPEACVVSGAKCKWDEVHKAD